MPSTDEQKRLRAERLARKKEDKVPPRKRIYRGKKPPPKSSEESEYRMNY